jgi:hypothetical protein
MGKFNLKIGKKRAQNDDSEPTSPTSPEEAPKLSLSSLALDSLIPLPSSTPIVQEQPPKNLLDEILGELKSIPSQENGVLRLSLFVAFKGRKTIGENSERPFPNSKRERVLKIYSLTSNKHLLVWLPLVSILLGRCILMRSSFIS